MDNLKESVFCSCQYHKQNAERLRTQLGEHDSITRTAKARYKILEDVIEESGLYGEYQKWLKQQVG